MPQHPPHPGPRQPQPPRGTANTLSGRKSHTRASVSQPHAPADADSHVTRFPKTYLKTAPGVQACARSRARHDDSTSADGRTTASSTCADAARAETPHKPARPSHAARNPSQPQTRSSRDFHAITASPKAPEACARIAPGQMPPWR